MLDAKDAKNITFDSINTYIKEIEDGIRKDASLGKYSHEHILDADNEIACTIIKMLRDAHYDVEDQSIFGMDGNWRYRLTITWDSNG